MTSKEFDQKFLGMTIEAQDAFINRLSELNLPEEEYLIVLEHFTLLQWFNCPEKYKAIRKATGEVLYKEFVTKN